MLLGVSSYAQYKSKARVSIDLGYGYRTASISNVPVELEDYADELKSGFNIDTHINYFIKPSWGLGATYSRFQSDNAITFASPTTIEGIETRSTSDDIRINFIAPEFLYRSFLGNEKHSFISTISIGYLAFKNESKINGTAIDITGGTVGFGFGLLYDYHITPFIAIGAGVNFIAGSLSKLELSNGAQSQTIDLPDDQRENLSRITINAGLRFYL